MSLGRSLVLASMLFTAVIGSSLPFGGAWAKDAPEKPDAGDAPQATTPAGPRHVDLAICLDTSNSMDGLIESARQKLWAIVNELATAEPKPILRVALFHYGNDGLNSETGWVEKISDLTDDLDDIYGKLFALKTHGGTEFVSRVVRVAANDLDWRTEGRPLKIIVVAGNEAATQDTTFALADVCRETAAKGIIINTIFCGNESEGAKTGWADAARWADGRYAAIDADRGTVVINTPYDKELADLGVALNGTYIPYGASGGAGQLNQLTQDRNAAELGDAIIAQRAIAKATTLYCNGRWDLVDAAKEKDFDLAKIPVAELPEAMQKMSLAERQAFIAKQAEARKQLQDKIADLSAKRDRAVKQELEARGLSENEAFDAALRCAVREQAEKNGFTFKAADTP